MDIPTTWRLQCTRKASRRDRRTEAPNTRLFYMVLHACEKQVDISEHLHTLLAATPANDRLLLDGKGLFDVILTTFTRDTTQERGLKLRDLYASNLKPNETGYDFIIRIEKKVRDLVSIGVALDLSRTCTTLVQTNFLADRRYKSIGEQLFLRAETDPLFDWDKLKNTVRVFDINAKSQQAQESSSSSQALQSFNIPRRYDQNPWRPACQNCGKFHSGVCRYRPPSESHYMRQPQGASSSAKFSTGKSSQPTFKLPSSTPFKCFGCGGRHPKKFCPQNRFDESSEAHTLDNTTEILDISAIPDSGASQSSSAFMLTDKVVSSTAT